MKANPVSLCAVALMLSLAFFSSCSTPATPHKTAAIAPPLKGIDVAMNSFTIDPTKNDTIRLASGTRIYIPAGTLVDARQTPLTKPVSLHYREFHTPADVIASGITMKYDSAGKQNSFKTAGMFDISATQDQQQVFVKKGNAVHIDLASYQNDGTYNFYSLDTASAKWSFLHTTQVAPNAARVADSAALAQEDEFSKPATPVEYDGKSAVIDLDVDINNFPSLTGYEGIMWQFTDAQAAKGYNWVYETSWNSVVLQPGNDSAGTYSLNLATAGKKFQAMVRPVLKGNNFQEALKKFKEKMGSFEAKMAQRNIRRAELENMANYQRSVDVPAFGIYNCDHIHCVPSAITMTPVFNFSDDEFQANPDMVSVYMLIGDDRTPVCYNAAEPGGFFFAPDQDNRLIAVLDGGHKAITMTAAEFMRCTKSGNISFKNAPKTVASFTDLKIILDQI